MEWPIWATPPGSLDQSGPRSGLAGTIQQTVSQVVLILLPRFDQALTLGKQDGPFSIHSQADFNALDPSGPEGRNYIDHDIEIE